MMDLPQPLPIDKQFVYDNIEVKLTGRIAGKKTSRKIVSLVEIMPYDNEEGTWKKWVAFKDLYQIVEENNSNATT